MTIIRKQKNPIDEAGMSNIHNVFDVDVTRTSEKMADATGKSECAELKEIEPVDKVAWWL